MMPAPAIGAISSGTRYQERLFWLHALPMLVRQGIDRVSMEVPDADGVDDVAVFYTLPGKNDRGEFTDVDFFQAKFHRDHRETIDSTFFTDHTRTKTNRPLLKRFADTWSAQRTTHPRCRITFVTNWTWDTADALHSVFTERDVLGERFFTSSSTTEIGQIREQWFVTSGLSRPDFDLFARRLRFHLPFSTDRMEEHLRDRMDAAGLEVPLLGRECNTLDELGRRFLEDGRTAWEPEPLRTTLNNEKMFASVKAPRRQVVSVRSFTRLSGLDLMPGDVDVDLTDRFTGRSPDRPDAWSKGIPAALEARLPEIARLRQPIELALDCHLSIAWHLGALLGPKSGLSVVLRQKSLGRGTEIWNPMLPAEGVHEWVLAEDAPGTDTDLVVAVSLTNPAADDVKCGMAGLGLGGARFLHFSHPQLGHGAVKDGAHAVALAVGLAEKIRELTSTQPAARTHFFLSAPVSFAFLFGQRSGLLGPATTYEFDFQGTRTYSPGMSSPKA